MGRLRRPIRLLVIGLASASSLGAAFAVAAVVVGGRHTAELASQPLSVRTEPSSRTVAPGASAQFAVRVMRRHVAAGLGGRTELSVGRELPIGAGVSFAPERGAVRARASNRMTTLTITTAADTPSGIYLLQVRAHRPHRNGSTAISLTVSPGPGSSGVHPTLTSPTPTVTTPDAFTIDGALPTPLMPGTAAALDLTLVNREGTDLSISSLSVQVSSAGGPQSDPAHPCGPGDFAVDQFSGSPGFTLPASSTASLSELGFEPDEWPEVTMLNLPVNQDGCKQASLRLVFAGTATEDTS
jgi:hypothetical protein